MFIRPSPKVAPEPRSGSLFLIHPHAGSVRHFGSIRAERRYRPARRASRRRTAHASCVEASAQPISARSRQRKRIVCCAPTRTLPNRPIQCIPRAPTWRGWLRCPID